MLKKILLVACGLVVLAATVIAVKIGPSNIIGMIRYDQRREGDLKVGDVAPAAMLVSLDGRSRVPLLKTNTGRPQILVFGSFT